MLNLSLSLSLSLKIPPIQRIGIFCPKEEVGTLIEALRCSPVIDWEDARKTHFLIHHVPPYAVDPLLGLLQEKGVNVELMPCFTYTYDVHQDSHTLR